MNEIFERIRSDMEKEDVTLRTEHISELKNSMLMLDDELEAKLVMVAARYLVEMESKDNIIAELRKEIKSLNVQYRELYAREGLSYKDIMEDKKKLGIYPADKKVSLKAITQCIEMGMTDKQICKSMNISRSTLWRKKKVLGELAKLPVKADEFSTIRLDGLKG